MNLIAKKILSLVDLTSLNVDDTVEKIKALCQKAQTKHGSVAAICVYPKFLSLVKAELPAIRLATVVNFPEGDHSISETLNEIEEAKLADEIDVVMPYAKLIASEANFVRDYLQTCREACFDKTLKVIIESGQLNPSEIKQASEICLEIQADFIKTSTGKTLIGATLDACEIILNLIKKSKMTTGLKISGGVKTLAIAESYYRLVSDKMGEDWISPAHLRFGASSLVDDISRGF